MGWVRVVGVECRDDGLLAAVGGGGRLIRTSAPCCVREINLLVSALSAASPCAQRKITLASLS